MGSGRPEIREHEELAAGVTGAARVVLRFPSIGRDLSFKWKVVPSGDADGWNNAPRKELAAYALQKWFLAPQDYVVPTTGLRCVPLADYRTVDAEAEPTLPGTRCVLVTEAVWLENVEVPEQLYDPARYHRDARYATHLAHFNMLTALIEHRDMRRGNALVSRDPANRRVFSIDNGIAFGGVLHNPWFDEWEELRVPALPRQAVERLVRVRPEDVRALAVVAQMRPDEDGVLHGVEPGEPWSREEGARQRDGAIQLGLTGDEIEEVAERLKDLFDAVEDGEVPLF